ncbi:MAG TPA: FG-GAP repeat protein, partial [Thermoanaerobaculales bacterium]|nr:FG-GAP repeat protein [Thermoanaerobaculales bacterium]
THSAHTSGDGVVVLDAAGKELWRTRFPGFTVQQSLVADLVGDREPDVALSLRSDGDPPAEPSQIQVFSRDRLIETIDVGGEALSRHPRQCSAFAAPQLAALDLAGDDHGVLCWLARNSCSYSSELGLADLHHGVVGPLFVNAGHLHSVAAGDVDGDGTPELVTIGINNLLGYQSAVAVLRAVPRPAGTAFLPSSSPDDLVTWRSGSARDGTVRPVIAYTLLGLFGGSPTIEIVGARHIVARTALRTVRLDAAGNPEGWPLFGQGPDARLRFWDELVDTCYEIEAGAERPVDRALAILDHHPEVLAEDPMHLGAVLLLSRSLSRAGEDPAAAAILLAAAVRRPDSADLWIRRATCEAAANDTGAALESLDTASRIGVRTSRTGEALYQMVRLSAFAGDGPRFEHAISQWSTKFTNSLGGSRHSSARALWAFFRGDWQDPSLTAAEAPDPGLPELRIAFAWAELARSGDAAPALARARELSARPELADLAALLEAEALACQGQLERAIALAAQAHTELERLGREELVYGLWAPLADHVAAKALAAQGRHAEATELSARAAAAAPACWFGQPPTTR